MFMPVLPFKKRYRSPHFSSTILVSTVELESNPKVGSISLLQHSWFLLLANAMLAATLTETAYVCYKQHTLHRVCDKQLRSQVEFSGQPELN